MSLFLIDRTLKITAFSVRCVVGVGVWCGVWGCGSSFGGKPFFRKRTVFPRPPLSKETYSNLYLFFSRSTT